MLDVNDVLEEIQKNHNWSLYDEIYDRNKNNLNKTALFYRGKNISYGEMFEKMNNYAMSLSAKGVVPGMEIPVCMNNTPEFVYLLGAASILGIKLNIFGEEFDKNYIKEIINNCNSNIIFVSDDKYPHIKDSIDDSKINNIVMVSLSDSLPNNEDPYKIFDSKFCAFDNKIKEYKNKNSNIESIDEFLQNKKDVPEHTSCLEDEFTVTYSSGSTNSLRPKAIVHKNKSYVTMGIFHDPKVSGTPSMKNLRILAQIPTHSNTNVQSCITDSLVQGATVCLEPIYDKDFFLYSLLINKTEFPCATRSFWVNLSKEVLNLKKHGVNVKFQFLLAPMSVGEPLSKGEEKLCNKMLKITKAGNGITHTPSSVVCMSVAGGDCEHGGIFFIMFRNLMNKLKRIPEDEYDILRTYSMVDVVILDKDGNICKNNETGRVYASSETNMIRYDNNKEATDKVFKNINGKEYLDCSVYGYKGKNDYIHIKGRMNEKQDEVPAYEIAEEILKDTKNILSCEVIFVNDLENGLVYVAHIEGQPDKTLTPKVLESALNRCKIKFGSEVTDKIVFNIKSNMQSYPLTGCGKRNNPKLLQEGLNNSVRPVIQQDNNDTFIGYNQYFNKENEKVLSLKK